MTNITLVKQQIIKALNRGSGRGVEIIRSNTPIDTQRLFETVEATPVIDQGDKVCCRIVLGGKNIYGVRREQNIKRPVNYAIYVEAKTGFVRSNMNQIRQAIISELKK